MTWSFRLTYRLSMTSCAVWLDCRLRKILGLKQRLTDRLLSVTKWWVSNVAKWNLVRTCKFRTANKTSPPLGIFESRNPRHAFAEPWSSEETSLRNTGLEEASLLYSILFLRDPLFLNFAIYEYRVLSHIQMTAIIFISLGLVTFGVLNKDRNGMTVRLNFKMPVVDHCVSG
jgi:hypothetical protein